ncbi:DinB family protein [Actinoplanes flavus]|uniref:DinB family protein n=1 Tax=Actinoplanes flavus TaxID=2820290 RepID=A0ABS3USN5_9ACTN|nr:DinB family protein [Actinoplanes flavus]MBO3741590.1 DinB family protein [Actinoplanes flavus]
MTETRPGEDDVREAADLAIATLRAATDRDWHIPAAGLTWTCWETIEHIADDLFAYAAPLTPGNPSRDTYVPFGWRRNREGGPALTVYAEDGAGPEGLIQVLDSSAGLLAAVVAVTPADRRTFHPYGVSDPSGFAAMGVVETLAHMHDVARALHLEWTPPEDLCDRALRRLFRDAPTGPGRWATLLWATGRGELTGRERRPSDWRWDGTPLATG